MAWYGVARQGAARLGLVRQGGARHGRARQGKARRGEARPVTDETIRRIFAILIALAFIAGIRGSITALTGL